MAINRFRGDATPSAKVLRLLRPNNVSQGVFTVVSVGNKRLEFVGWDADEIAAGLNSSGFPELANVNATVTGLDVSLTGGENEDFDVQVSISPTVEVEFNQGSPPVNQQTRLNFDAADGGTFTLTCNNETTAAITLKTSGAFNTGGVQSAIEALTSFASGDVSVFVDSGDIVLEWIGNYAAQPVAVKMDATGLNNGGQVVFVETQSARPATHDIYWLGIDGDYVFDITDGSTPLEVKSNESEADLSARFSAAWGGQVDVYIHVTGDKLTQRNAFRRIMYIDMVGFPGATTNLSVSGIEPNDSNPPQVAISKVISSADASPHEVILLDQREGPVAASLDGAVVDFSTASDLITSLNEAVQFGEWTVWRGPTGFDGGTELGGGNIQTDELCLIFWFDDGLRRANTYPTTYQLPVDDGGGTDFDFSRFEFHEDNLGTMRVLQHGGSTNAARPAVHEFYLQPNTAGNTLTGSYKLSFAEGITSALTESSNAAAVQSAINTATGITVAVSGAGTAASPFSISYTGDTSSRNLPSAVETSFTGDGNGVVSADAAAFAGVSASATIRVSLTADDGTFDLISGNEGPVSFNWNEDGASFLTKLQNFPSLATPGDVVVNYNAASREYLVNYTAGLALQEVDQLLLQRNQTSSVTQSQATREIDDFPSGPGNWADAVNWSLGRLPETGDEILLDFSDESITYGLRQFVQVAIDTTDNTLTAAGGHDLQNGQKVQFLFGDAAPTGVSAGTDYFVINSDRTDGIFQVSATEGGAAVNITAAGTGPHFCGVIAGDVTIPASFDQGIGLERDNSEGFEEYRQRFLAIGIAATGVIEVGRGDGVGSGLIRIDPGNSAGEVVVYETGASEVDGKPACVLSCLSDNLRLRVHSGDVGIAVYDDEVAKLGSFNCLAGSLFVGSVTVVNNAIAGRDTLTSQRMSVNGLVRIT
ncbi:MAG: hypothetical protein NXI04_17500 [Planctomycetaceae bacterium]|nr:hypothetical protein [Planctomycetaceae bacterium]